MGTDFAYRVFLPPPPSRLASISQAGYSAGKSPGAGLLRLASALGLSSAEDADRVRSMAARAALDSGDRVAACEILRAAVLRREPRRRGWKAGGGVGRGGGDGGGGGERGEEAGAFAPELCEALELTVSPGEVVGREGEEGWRVWRVCDDRTAGDGGGVVPSVSL